MCVSTRIPESPDGVDHIGEANPVLQHMRQLGLPFTRDAYLSLNYPDGPPDPWTAEDEMELPRMFRKQA